MPTNNRLVPNNSRSAIPPWKNDNDDDIGLTLRRNGADAMGSPSNRRYRRMETITATTFKIANPGTNSHINNLNLEYDYEQQPKPFSKGNVLHREYQDDPPSQTALVNHDINNRFNYLEDLQYQRSKRNFHSNTHSNTHSIHNNNISNHGGMIGSNFNNSNNNRNNSSPIPSNKVKRSLSRTGQFFD